MKVFFSETHHQTLQVFFAIFHGTWVMVRLDFHCSLPCGLLLEWVRGGGGGGGRELVSRTAAGNRAYMMVFVNEYHEVYPVDNFSKETLTYPESELRTSEVELGVGGEGLSFSASECHILLPEDLSFKTFRRRMPPVPCRRQNSVVRISSPVLWKPLSTPDPERFIFNCYFCRFPVWLFIHPTMKK